MVSAASFWSIRVLHDGHGVESVSPLLHYLVEWPHVLPLVAGVIVVTGFVLRRRGHAAR